MRWKELTLEGHAKSLGQCPSVIRKWRRRLEDKGILPPGELRPYDKWMNTTGVQVVRLGRAVRPVELVRGGGRAVRQRAAG